MDPSETNDPTSIWAHVEACRELIKDRCQRLLTKTLHDDITEEKAAEEIHARILEGVKHCKIVAYPSPRMSTHCADLTPSTDYAALGVGDGVPEGNSAKQLALHSFLAFLASCGEEIRKSTTNANKAGFRGWEEHACGILRHLIDPLNLKVLTRSATDFLSKPHEDCHELSDIASVPTGG